LLHTVTGHFGESTLCNQSSVVLLRINIGAIATRSSDPVEMVSTDMPEHDSFDQWSQEQDQRLSARLLDRHPHDRQEFMAALSW
jgi:hypothetical protein